MEKNVFHLHLEPQSQPERNGWNETQSQPFPKTKGFQAGVLGSNHLFLVGTGVHIQEKNGVFLLVFPRCLMVGRSLVRLSVYEVLS